jgi:hypothetical protein
VKKTIDGQVVEVSTDWGCTEKVRVSFGAVGELDLRNVPADPNFLDTFEPGARIRITIERVEQ